MSSAKRGKTKHRRPRSGPVVIVGAGAAGLAAGRALREAGVPFTILEARNRIGGRVFTTHPRGLSVPVELGAEFTHGEAEQVIAIANERGLRVADIGGERWRSQGGKLRAMTDFWERLDRVMRRLDEEHEPDRTFADAMAHKPSIDAEDRALAMQFVQGFHAANPTIISERALAEGGSPRGDERAKRVGRVLDGYDKIIDALADGLRSRIRLRAVVRDIAWRRGEVTVRLAGGGVVRGSAAIIAVPIGVLAAPAGERGAIQFDPPLPAKRAAVGAMAMGNVMRIGLRFAEPFWTTTRFATIAGNERLDLLSFVYGTSDLDFPVWWTTYPVRSPLLIGWCGGPRALQMAGLPKEEVEALAVRSLAKVMPTTIPTLRKWLVSSHMHDWMADPFSRGVYSYARVGAGDASARLARPVEGTLYFAGEAADIEGRTGTVHGAIATGQRAAGQVLGH